MASEIQTNEQDRVIRPGELTFTDEWAGSGGIALGKMHSRAAT